MSNEITFSFPSRTIDKFRDGAALVHGVSGRNDGAIRRPIETQKLSRCIALKDLVSMHGNEEKTGCNTSLKGSRMVFFSVQPAVVQMRSVLSSL